MIKLIILCLFVNLTLADARNDQIISVIDLEISELSRLSRISKNNDPETLLRIAELYLEKARVLRDSENEAFFKRSQDDKRKIDKKKFYAGSTSYFAKAQETGLFILKKFSKFKDIGDVYYILAFNEKERANFTKSKQLFSVAIKKTKKGSGANVKSRLAIGDIYYAEGDFKKSKAYYDSVINNISNDKWYTRYLYNLSWSNYRLGKKTAAIEQMKQVNELSKKSIYVDKSETAQRDLGYFYADSGNIKAATNFFTQVGGNSAKNFFDMGLQLKDRQKFSEALKMFKSSLGANDEEYKKRSLLELLSIYDKYNNNGYFLKYAEEIKKMALSADQKKEALFYITKRAVLIQKELGLSHNKNRPKTLALKGTQAAKLYVISREIDPSLNERATFFAAESYYASKQYEEALIQYEIVKNIGNTKDKYYQRALNGMLLAINEKGISKQIREKYFESLYVEFIRAEQNPAKKAKAVEKLFSFYIDEKKDPASAEKLFFQYAAVYRDNVDKNEAMIGRIVDLYKKDKKKDELMVFVKGLKSASIPLRPKFIAGLNKIVLLTQFDSVQKANQNGNKVVALKGYLMIYSDKDTTPEAKRNAAYNIAVLFYESGNMHLMSQWMQRSISEMDTNEIVNFSESFGLMIKELFLRQRFDEGLHVSELYLKKTCSKQIKAKDDIYNNYMIMGLAQGKINEISVFNREQKLCALPSKMAEIISTQMLDYYLDIENVSNAVREYYVLDAATNDSEVLVKYLGRVLNVLYTRGESIPNDLNSKFFTHYGKLKNKSGIGIDAVDYYAATKFGKLLRISQEVKAIKLAFPQENYNAQLMKKLGLINTLTAQAVEVLSIGSGEETAKTYSLLIDSYTEVASEVEGFTPEGKDAEYISSFKKGMSQVVTPLKSKVFEFQKEMKDQISKNKVLSRSYGNLVRKSIRLEHQNEMVLMDKRGM